MTINVDIHVINNILLIINSILLGIVSFRYRSLYSEVEATRAISQFFLDQKRQDDAEKGKP